MPGKGSMSGLRPFKKGQSGNPGGRPKAVMDVIETARQHTPLAMNTLAEVAANVEEPAAARVAACTVLLDRGWGKPTQAVQHSGELNITGGIDAPPRTTETREEWLARRRAELAQVVAAAGQEQTRH